MISRSIDRTQTVLFSLFGFITLLSIFIGLWKEQYLLAVVPAAALIVYMAITDFKSLYFFLIAVLPFTLEINLPGSLALDVPAEPLVIGLMLVTVLYIFLKKGEFNGRFLLHPIIIFLIIHWFWILFASLFAVDQLVSFKFFLAKSWYIITFCFLTSMVLKDEASIKKFFWAFFIPLFILVGVSMFRQYLKHFPFEDVNDTVMPYFRNHVNYAVTIAAFLPYLFFARTWYQPGTFNRRFISLSILIFIVAIWFSYTRAAMLSVIAMPFIYFTVRYNLLKWVSVTAFAGAIGLLIYFSTNNRYLEFAPDYEKTVMHDDFGAHMSATFQGQDVSSMERFYRWIAALHMIQERPFTGFGPGNFYPSYQHYTVSDFETYISDNEERSTVHNYFLLMLVEQGLIGCFLFIVFVLSILFFGNSIYRKFKNDVQTQNFIMAVLLSIIIILINILLSDLIEDIKIGGLFWIAVALLVTMGLRKKSEEAAT